MLLKRCYISNFGKLQDFSYDFAEGLNIICEENGWGKSTFAAFLRAMLYGMPQAGSRTKLAEAERRRFKPWQGGETGGYLVFEVNGKTYKAERTFGAKEAEDTFRLIDLSTNLVSLDFSPELGKELFGLDKEAYSRTTYLPQNRIFDGGMNESIGRKLGRMAEGDEESGNFEKAYGALDELRKKYIPDRQRDEKGYVAELTRRISETEALLESCHRKEENAKPWRERERAAAEKRRSCSEELQECRAELEAAAGYEAAVAKKKHYDELCRQEEKLKRQKEEIESLFLGEVPEAELLRISRAEAEEAAALSGELRICRLSEEEEHSFFSLQQSFLAGVPDIGNLQEDIRSVCELEEKNAEAELFCAQAQKLAEEEKKAAKRLFAAFLLSMVLLLAGGGSTLYWKICGGLTAAGGCCLLAAGVCKRKKAKREEEKRKQWRAAILDNQERERELLCRYGLPDGSEGIEALKRLAENAGAYIGLSEKRKHYELLSKRKQELLAGSRELLSRYRLDVNDISGGLYLLEQRRRDFFHFSEELAEAVKKREQFEGDNPSEMFLGLIQPKESYVVLQQRERELMARMACFEEEEKDCRDRAEVFEESAEAAGELSESLASLREELAGRKKEHFWVTETMKCLKNAKEQFSSRYMSGLQKSFHRYISLLGEEGLRKTTGGRFEGVEADINLQVQVSAYGKGKELGYFSTGLQDLIGLCMRFSLVDTLFENEEPFLILDDPFVNLDEEKLKNALAFLHKAGEKYQILYFVCHGSRV